MKKIIGLIVVILVSLILGSYYVTGALTEGAIKKNIMTASQFGGMVNIKDYQRHWFTSTALVTMHVTDQVLLQQKDVKSVVGSQGINIDVPIKIFHGPIIYSGSKLMFGLGYAKGNLVFSKQALEYLVPIYMPDSKAPSISVDIKIGYLGQSNLNFNIPPFKLIGKDNKGSFEFSGFKGDLDTSSDLHSIKGNMDLDGLNVAKDNSTFKIHSFDSQYQLHQSVEGLYVGLAEINLQSIILLQDNQPIIDLSQLKASTDSSISDGLFQSLVKISFEKLLLNTKSYGASLFEASIKNIDAKVLGNLNQESRKLNTLDGPERQKVLFSMLPEFGKLFGKGPVLELANLKLALPEGNMTGTFKFSITKDESLNPFQLLQKIEGAGQFQFPSQFVAKLLMDSLKQKEVSQSLSQDIVVPAPDANKIKAGQSPEKQSEAGTETTAASLSDQQLESEIQKKLDALVQLNILMKRGNDYKVEFAISQGILKINGQIFDPTKFRL